MAPLTRDEESVSKILGCHKHQEVITYTDAKKHVSSRQRSQARIEQLFDLAATLGAGSREGSHSTSGSLCFRLDLSQMSEASRQRLGLEAQRARTTMTFPSTLEPVASLQIPEISGCATRPLSELPHMCGGMAPKRGSGREGGGKGAGRAGGGRGAGRAGGGNQDRPAEHGVQIPLTVTASWQTEGEPLAKEAFLQEMREWCSHKVPGQFVETTMRQDTRFNHGYKFRAFCSSCSKCVKGKGWRATVVYSIADQRVTIEATSADAHGDFQRTRKAPQRRAAAQVARGAPASIALTGQSKKLVETALRANPRVRLQDIMMQLQERSTQMPLPSELSVHHYINNLRKRQSAMRKPKTIDWAVCDFEQLLRDLPNIRDVSGDDICDLCWIDRCLDPHNTWVTLCCPRYVREVFGRLANTNYLKLCGDGTFRTMRQDFVLLTLGVLTKHYGELPRHAFGFATTFNELVFAITNKESEVTYTGLFESCILAANLCAQIDIRDKVAQYHCDWHAGEENARQKVWHCSTRAGDFAHLMGYTRPKAKK